MFGFPKKIDITGKAVIVEISVWNHKNINDILNFRSFRLVDNKLNRYSNHGNSGAVSEYRGGISNTTDLRPNSISKYYVVFDINPDSYAVFLETAEGSSSGGCLTFSLASEVIIPSSNSNDNIGTRTNSKLNSLANQYLDALSTQKERFSSAKNSATESSELINTNEKPHVNKLTKKSISIVSGVLVTCIVLSWLGWTLYQRSTYESLLTSAQKITANVSSNNRLFWVHGDKHS